MTDLLQLSGSLVVRGDDDVPTGGVATVKVVDAEGEVLAATAVDADELPVAWSLTVDPALVADPDRLLVWAMLRTDAGVWGTPELARGTDEETVLVRVDGA